MGFIGSIQEQQFVWTCQLDTDEEMVVMKEEMEQALSAAPLLFKGLDLVRELLERARGIKGAQILEQHIELLREQVTLQGKAHAQAQEALAKAESRVAELEEELAAKWKRFGGGLFHILPSGKLDFAVYCPRCRVSTDPFNAFTCRTEGCGWRSGVHISQLRPALEKVALELGVDLGEPLFEPEAIAERSKPKQRGLVGPGLGFPPKGGF